MSRDYTLLAKLGFADPDKQDGTHDAACRFLAQAEVARKLWIASADKVANPGRFCDGERLVVPDRPLEFLSVSIEEPISKGSGQYKTTIGFMDVVLFGKEEAFDIEGRRSFPAFGIGIEVKHTQKAIHDAVRQIQLYREYTDNPYGISKIDYRRPCEMQWGTRIIDWYLATTFNITQQEAELLSASDIKFIKLSSAFEEYLNKKNETPWARLPDIVL